MIKYINLRKHSTFLSNLFILIFISCQLSPSKAETNITSKERNKIMLALLLDTSNSMDGLIEQAKSQLWTIVNELATAKCKDDSKPSIQIALYEYGNSNLPASEGFIRMVTPLTDDLDEISKNLFELKTNGGDEFCGQVIQNAIRQLDWSESKADLKLIFIAGNEPFNQGNVPYVEACNLAKNNNIFVNTIFCGNFNEGINTSWKSGALITGGSYMSIAQNTKTVYSKTPYDDQINQLNNQLNDTYIYYGSMGIKKKREQLAQDINAEFYGKENKVKRAISKSSHVYQNSNWDLVDALKDDSEIIEKVEKSKLPNEMKNMTNKEKKEYIDKQTNKRNQIQKEIQSLSLKRKQYINENKKENKKEENSLDAIMLKSIKKIAQSKELVFE